MIKRAAKRPRYSVNRQTETPQPIPESGLPSRSPQYGMLRRGLGIFPRFIYHGLKQRLESGGSEPMDVTALDGFPGGGTTFLRDDGTFATPSGGAAPDVTDGTTTVPAPGELQLAGGHFTVTNNGGDAAIDAKTNVANGLAGLDASADLPLAQLPLHASTHEDGGADELAVTDLGGFPGGGTTFLRDDGTFAAAGGATPHALLDGVQNNDTLSAAPSRGSLIVGNATPLWSEMVIGSANRVLKSDGTDASWAQVDLTTAMVTGALPIGNGGTGQTAKTAAFDALSPVTTRGDLIVRDASNNVRLAIGTIGFTLTSDGTDAGWRKNYGTTVYVPTTADVAINNVSDQTIATRDVASVAAGDTVIIEGEFIILNNSTATRVYVITVDFDNAFDIEISTGALATSSTLMHPFTFRASCTIRSTSLAYGVVRIDGQLAAGIAAGGDTTMAATHLSGKGWGTSTSDLTGTLTCNLKIRSADATATQTCRLVCFEVRRLTPGTPLGA